jgi:hypothetical protein
MRDDVGWCRLDGGRDGSRCGVLLRTGHFVGVGRWPLSIDFWWINGVLKEACRLDPGGGLLAAFSVKL